MIYKNVSLVLLLSLFVSIFPQQVRSSVVALKKPDHHTGCQYHYRGNAHHGRYYYGGTRHHGHYPRILIHGRHRKHHYYPRRRYNHDRSRRYHR